MQCIFLRELKFIFKRSGEKIKLSFLCVACFLSLESHLREITLASHCAMALYENRGIFFSLFQREKKRKIGFSRGEEREMRPVAVMIMRARAKN